MGEADARARIRAQAGDDARRAAADVLLANDGDAADLESAVDELWQARLVPFEENLRRGRPAPLRNPVVVGPDPTWAEAASRLAARIAAAVSGRGRGVDHVGPTAVPGMPAVDVLDLQLGVPDAADVTGLRDALASAGFPSCPLPGPIGTHATADPGRPARLVVRPVGSPEWRASLLHRDWLRAGAPGALSPGPPPATPSADTLAWAQMWAESSEWSPSVR
jgi:dephospho-CoA kinase